MITIRLVHPLFIEGIYREVGAIVRLPVGRADQLIQEGFAERAPVVETATLQQPPRRAAKLTGKAE